MNHITPEQATSLAAQLNEDEFYEMHLCNAAIQHYIDSKASEDFCYCHDGVSLQMVSGGGAPDGYLGKVTLRIGDQYRDYYTHPSVDSIDTSQERVEKSEESVQMAEPDFCDKNCVWSDHHPDCILFDRAAPTGEGA
jgi:hypothetical protein